MNSMMQKTKATRLRKKRVRAKVSGTAKRPRLSVTISHHHVSVQLIDDTMSKTILSATTVGQKSIASLSLSKKAAHIGHDIGQKAKKAKITQLVFDRNGRHYASRLNALAESVREEGIKV